MAINWLYVFIDILQVKLSDRYISICDNSTCIAVILKGRFSVLFVDIANVVPSYSISFQDEKHINILFICHPDGSM